MSRYARDVIKNKKAFYVYSYRMGIIVLTLSLVVNTILALMLYYRYTHLPVRAFYATDGITPPVKLNPLLAPNESSEALLPPDPVRNQDDIKVIPQ